MYKPDDLVKYKRGEAHYKWLRVNSHDARYHVIKHTRSGEIYSALTDRLEFVHKRAAPEIPEVVIMNGRRQVYAV